jgi:hypothetical protein
MARHSFRVRTLADRWNRQCGQKFPHPDRASAHRESVRLEQVERAKFNSYHCECCGAWHVGHKRNERFRV